MKITFFYRNKSFPQLLQQQIKATRGENHSVQEIHFCIVPQKGLRHANCIKALCKTLIGLMVQNMSKIAKEIGGDIGF